MDKTRPSRNIGGKFIDKMNFRPTKWKVISTIIVTIVWYILIFLFLNSGMCKPCSDSFRSSDCPKVFSFKIFPYGCSCVCPEPINVSFLLKELLLLLFPGIILYFIWSSGQKNSKINSKRKLRK
jgi:hypothetical protein